ncbi:MAG: hypothetical protein HFH23_16525 [Ruminococcus sp.]|nr:hypothetical protein [Ruminococcus sp.]
MSKTALNDVTYNFEPLELYVPDPDYKVNQAELQKSIQKSQEFIAFIHDYKEQKKASSTKGNASCQELSVP